jgi:glycerate kinase
MAAGLRAAGLDPLELPLGDGGEGTLDVLLAAVGGTRRCTSVTGPLDERVEAEWAVLADGTAVIEAARASGLALTAGRNDPVRATTAGVGELLQAAADEGVSHALVCVGGSATTDGGLGAIKALGWSLGGLRVDVACDVATRFSDAAAVFGPQKGADPEQVDLLTRRLDRLTAAYRDRTGVDVSALPGAGAAGGLAGGLAALGASLRPGFDLVAEATGLAAALAGRDAVVTGEGRVDGSSFKGKVVGGVLALAGAGRRRAVIGGEITAEGRRELPPDVLADSLVDHAGSEAEAIGRAAELLEEAALRLGRQLAGPAAE